LTTKKTHTIACFCYFSKLAPQEHAIPTTLDVAVIMKTAIFAFVFGEVGIKHRKNGFKKNAQDALLTDK